ncbi:MAG: 2-oxoglutarate ferredoxin oxidoreductase subunit gamma [Clostridiales bacterium]|nr:2-oxoglutarate ferredoxin oxidoreductase subunit gamma [Clostridiales bacterium]
MSSTQEIIMAGFGGQGVMFAGKLIAYTGMLSGKEVSWLPSYGPEMRGGTANCHAIVSDEPIGSPIIINPTILIAMNRPSLDKFEDTVVSGGIIVVDSSLIDRQTTRKDIKSIEIPATQMAADMGAGKLANMILLGKLIKETGFLSMDIIKEALKKVVPSKKQHLLDINMKALELGYNY